MQSILEQINYFLDVETNQTVNGAIILLQHSRVQISACADENKELQRQVAKLTANLEDGQRNHCFILDERDYLRAQLSKALSAMNDLSKCVVTVAENETED